jgi:hypothetical protein
VGSLTCGAKLAQIQRDVFDALVSRVPIFDQQLPGDALQVPRQRQRALTSACAQDR